MGGKATQHGLAAYSLCHCTVVSRCMCWPVPEGTVLLITTLDEAAMSPQRALCAAMSWSTAEHCLTGAEHSQAGCEPATRRVGTSDHASAA